VIVNTGGSHADLHHDYIALENEMKAVAKFLGGRVLREFSREELLKKLPEVRLSVTDRAILRALHFYDDDLRVVDQVGALEAGRFNDFLNMVTASGNSSWTLLQNCYSSSRVDEQGISVALAITARLLEESGAWRVPGGGLAGTIQALMPADMVDSYKAQLEPVFGEGSCHQLLIRPVGTTHVGSL